MGRWPQIDNLAAIAACLKPKTKEVRQFLGLAEAALKQAVTVDVRIDDGYIKYPTFFAQQREWDEKASYLDTLLILSTEFLMDKMMN